MKTTTSFLRRTARPVLVAVALSVAAPATADVPEAAYAAVNRALTDGYAIPGYRRLAGATADFRKTADTFCASGAPADLARTKAAYHATMDAWMRVQPLAFGPVELLMRNFRLQFWPAPRNRVGRDVAELLAAQEPISAAGLVRAGVAVQGLPAAELLLFGAEAKGLMPGTRHCALLTAIGANIAEIARGIVADWTRGPDAFRRSVLEPKKDAPYFATARDASLTWFKSLHNALELIVAAKLGPVAGSAKKGSVSDLESAASGRSLRNIVLTLEAARALYLGPNDDGFTAIVRSRTDDPALDPLMRRAFTLTLETARSIRPPIARALDDPAERKKIDRLMLQCRALKQIVATRLARATGLAVGFNARDGD